MVKRLALLAVWFVFALGALWFLLRGEHPNDDSRGFAEPGSRPPMESQEPQEPQEPFAEELPAEGPARLPEPATDPGRANGPEPVEPALPAPAVLGITVLDPELQALPDAEVLVLDSENGIQTARTDVQGRAEFAPHSGVGSVFVRPRNAQPRRESCNLSAGERRVVLLAGTELSGWVTVDGAAPGRPITLALESDQALFDATDVPQGVREFLALQSGPGSFVAVGATDAKGRFAFRGLAEAWSGALTVAREYTLREPGITESELRRLRVAAPTRNLQVELTRLPLLVGRIVDEHGEPVPESGLTVRCTIRRPGGFFHGAAELGEGGRFAVAIEPDFDSVEIQARSPKGSASVHRTRAEVGDPLDAGDNALAPGEALSESLFVVRVRDAAGAPLARAGGRVRSDPRSVTISGDPRGELRWKGLPDGETEVTVSADGFWPLSRPVTLPRAEPLVLALAPCNGLSVTVEDAQGRRASVAMLYLSAGAEPLFAEDGAAVDHRRFSATSIGTRDDDGRRWRAFLPVEPGRFVVQRLPPSVELRARLVDFLRTDLHAQQIAPLSGDEQRELTLRLASELHALAVLVRDEAGTPLVGVDVSLEVRGGPLRRTGGRTNSAGKLLFDGLASPSVFVAAQQAGFVAEPPRETALAGGLTEVELVLRRGRAVSVEVFDPIGRLVELSGEYGDVGLGAARPGGEPAWWARLAGQGRFAFEALPLEALELTLKLAGASYTARLGPGDASARFDVPMHGRIEATLALSALPDGAWYLVQVVPKGSSEVLLKRTISAAAATVAVFPTVPAGEYTVTLARAGFDRAEEVLDAPRIVRVEPNGVATVALRAP